MICRPLLAIWPVITSGSVDQFGILTRSLDEELRGRRSGAPGVAGQPSRSRSLQPDAAVEETVEALHRYLTWTPSRLRCSLADAVGERQREPAWNY